MHTTLRAVALALVFSSAGLYAQTDTTTVQKITLTDDSELIGVVVRESQDTVIFRTTSGTQATIVRKSIKTKQDVSGAWIGGKFMRSDPNQTRLFFAPTGRTLPGGRGYFSAYEIFFPMIAIGVTDFITVAGGMTLIPGAREQMVYFAPKVRIVHTGGLDIGGGVLYLSVTGHSAGIAYGVTTIGSQKASITAGLGWGFIDGDFAGTPSLVLGGELQMSNSTKLITENWFPAHSDIAIISFGVRFFGENIAGDFGLMRTTAATGSGFPFLPWIGFTYNF